MTDDEIQKLVDDTAKSAGYRHIDRAFIRTIAQVEAAKGRSYKETLKAVKNKLHQVGGAYQPGKMVYDAWTAELEAAQLSGDPHELKQVCRRIMSFHASTRERLAILDTFYEEIFKVIPKPRSILDAACGLNPLSIPWMDLPEGTRYTAVDIYANMVEFIGGFFRLVGIDGQSITADVIEFPPSRKVDLALVLKTIPCLEQVDKAAGQKLMDNLQADRFVVSFPGYSLGGRSKGMKENYRAHLYELIDGRGWSVEEIAFPNELVFLIEKAGRRDLQGADGR